MITLMNNTRWSDGQFGARTYSAPAKGRILKISAGNFAFNIGAIESLGRRGFEDKSVEIGNVQIYFNFISNCGFGIACTSFSLNRKKRRKESFNYTECQMPCNFRRTVGRTDCYQFVLFS